MKKNIIILSVLLPIGSLSAQVTIGADVEPQKAALLELATQQADGDNVTSTKGGLIIPRVKLVSATTLEPFIATTDPDWTNNATTKIKEKHAGLIVYNLTANTTFSKGLYVWDGAEWREHKHARDLVQTADNGLTLSNSHLKWGGALTNASTAVTVDAGTQQLKFDIANSSGSAADKGLLITGLQSQTDSKAVTVNVNTGKLGLASVIPAAMTFFQSGDESTNIASTINTGSAYKVAWSPGDQIFNNLVTFNDADDCFIAQNDGIFEISAFVSYAPRYNTAGSDASLLNATLQVARYPSTTTWIDYSSVRMVWVGIGAVYRQTLNIPPVLLTVSTGDRIRLIIQRPPTATGTGVLGAEHNYSSSSSATGIAPPFGTNFSKGIKILAVQ
ncbi:MAG: hypothetical protein LBD45_02880 [Bacteroidales bacterium]|jgi:hypothetical protein|nr:hypothetical protein [Bacteroidales bacterium]